MALAAELSFKVKNKYLTNYETEICDYLKRAQALALYELLGDANYIRRDVEIYAKITPGTFGRMCRKYLTKKNSSVLWYMKS